jgi:hypothetical protein
MTLQELLDLYKIEYPGSPLIDDEATLITLLDQSHKAVIKDGGLLKGSANVSGDSVALTQEYARPTALMDIDRQGGIRYAGKRLIYITIDELDADPDIADYTAGSGGTPTHYYIPGLTGQNLGLYTKPDTAGDVIKVHGTIWPILPATLTTKDTDKTFDQATHLSDFDELIIFKAVAKAKRGAGDNQGGERYEMLYTEGLWTAIKKLKPKDEETRAFGVDPFLAKKYKQRH